MSMRDILSADMPTLRRWLLLGWRWWLDQLAAMLPGAGWLARHRGPIVAHGDGDPSTWQVTGGGPSIERLSDRQRRNILVALDRNDVLCRTIDTPLLGRGDLRQMLALDIDRIGPLPMDAVCFDHEVVARGPASLSVRVAMIPLPRLNDWRSQWQGMDFAPVRIAMRDDDGTLHFDFLSAMGDVAKASGPWRWWMAVALLVLLNVGAIIWRDMAAVEAMRTAVEEQAPAGRTALLMRGRLIREQQRRAQLVEQRDRSNPLLALAAMSSALPNGAWVQRLDWNGSALRLVGYAPADVDVAEALRASPLLRSVAENDSEAVPSAEAEQMRAFDISATLARGGAR